MAHLNKVCENHGKPIKKNYIENENNIDECDLKVEYMSIHKINVNDNIPLI